MPSSAFTPPPEIYTLSLHDALPICRGHAEGDRFPRMTGVDHVHARLGQRGRDAVDRGDGVAGIEATVGRRALEHLHDECPLAFLLQDRKSTRLNSSHRTISYAVFCFHATPRDLHSFPTRRSSDLPRSRRG